MKIRTLATRRTVAGLSLVAAGLAAGGTVAGVGTASAATPGSSATASPSKAAETALTGTTLDSVKAAVLAKYPGATFGKVTTEDTGGYEAHITTAAGQSLTALVNTAFAVAGTEAKGAGHGRGGGAGETPLTGATASSVKAAVLAKYPSATFTRVETDNGGVYEAHIVTAAGDKLTVALDKAFAITGAK